MLDITNCDFTEHTVLEFYLNIPVKSVYKNKLRDHIHLLTYSCVL